MMMTELNHRVGAEEGWREKQIVTRLYPREGPLLPPAGMIVGMRIALAIAVIVVIKAISSLFPSLWRGQVKPLPSKGKRGEPNAGGENTGQGRLEASRGTGGVGGRGGSSGGEGKETNGREVRKAPVNAGGVNDNTDPAVLVIKVPEEVGLSLAPSAGLQAPASGGGARSCKPRGRRRHKKKLSQAITPATKATTAHPTAAVSSSKERKGIGSGVAGACPGGGRSEGAVSRLLGSGKEPQGILGCVKPQKGSILGIHPWCGGLRLAIPDDGDCFGIAWMVGALIWGAQNPSVIDHILARFAVAKEAGAFRNVTPEQQVSISYLVEFISGIHQGLAAHNGVDVAITVIKMLMTSSDLHRTIVHSSRALDLWCVHGIEEGKDLKRWRTIGEAVEFNLGETLPSGHIMRPGLGLQLLVDLRIERLGTNADGGDSRIVEGYMDLFRESSNGGNPEVEGISLLKGELPHYDIFIDAESPLGRATVRSFRTTPLTSDDPVALVDLKIQRDSQAKLSLRDIASLIGQDAYEEALRAEEEWAATPAAVGTVV